MVFDSYSLPQMTEECSHCTADDETCWEMCLTGPSEDDEYYNEYNNEYSILNTDYDDFVLSKNNMPCGRIRVCLKPSFANKPICKNAPKKMPARCQPGGTGGTGATGGTGGTGDPGNKMPCARIRVCMKPGISKKPICKDAPKILPARCKGPTLPPPPPPCPPKRNPTCGNDPPITHNPRCKCLSKELDGPGLPIGHCLTKDPANGKFFCYVDANSCGDTKPSRRFHNLYYSYQACWNQRAEGYAAPNCDCQESDDQCQSNCLLDVCEENPYCWEDLLSSTASEDTSSSCDCQDWDDQCWTDCLTASEETGSSCDCQDWDDQCWTDCLTASDYEGIEQTPEKIEPTPTGCYCQDWDDQCFERCYSGPITITEERP